MHRNTAIRRCQKVSSASRLEGIIGGVDFAFVIAIILRSMDTRVAKHAYSTQADKAYETICKAIINGDFKPGEKLSRRKMASLTGVSIIPVIEALHRLENEGLVESRPHWGSRVVELTPETIRDRVALRESVECQVARMLCGRLTPLQMQELQTVAAEIDKLSLRREDSLYWERHHYFHHRMAEYTGCQSLIDALHRINLFTLLQRAETRARDVPNAIPADNHRQIVESLKGSDPAVAEQAVRDHIYQSRLISKDMVYVVPQNVHATGRENETQALEAASAHTSTTQS